MCLAMAPVWQRWGNPTPMNMDIPAPRLTQTRLNIPIHVTEL